MAFITVGILFIMFAGIAIPGVYRAKECSRVAACIGNLKQMGMVCSVYADDYNGFFPPDVSYLYLNYASSLTIFICSSKRPEICESDILKDFTMCYEYVKGLKTEDRNVVFANLCVKRVKKERWVDVWQKHKKALNKKS
ncbi:MAG TPA: hypothetical protein PKK91_04390 [bacterium]|jgi:hypothetical protein|nr:hypothetical protein [bacterium]HQL65308.1 hypothetical protein [bacterium]